MIGECLAMSEMIVVFYVVIFHIRHYGKISFTREISRDCVFPAGAQGILN